MKNLFLIVVLNVLLHSYILSQNSWTQINEPLFWKGTPTQLINANNTIFANVGFAIYKFNELDQSWEYAGNNLMENNPYQYLQSYFIWQNNLYVQSVFGIMKYNESNNSWIEQSTNLFEQIPSGYEFKKLSACSFGIYALVTKYDENGPHTKVLVSTDFQNWTEATEIDDINIVQQVFNINQNHIIWLDQSNNIKLFNGTTIQTIDFGVIPNYGGNYYAWVENLKGESTGDYLYFKASDNQLYSYSISQNLWVNISNNFPNEVNIIKFNADDGLVVVANANQYGLKNYASTNGGISFFEMHGSFGAFPLIDKVCKQSNNKYWFTNIVNDMLFSNDNGANVNIKNQNLNSGMNTIVKFNNKIYSCVQAYGVAKTNGNNLSFVLDNTGLPSTLGMYVPDMLIATNEHIFCSVLEDLGNQLFSIYYKGTSDNAWIALNSFSSMKEIILLGTDNQGNLYVESKNQSYEQKFWRISNNLEVTDLSANYPAFVVAERYDIIQGNNNELYLFFKDFSNKVFVYRSNDYGVTWSDINLNHPNLALTTNPQKLGGMQKSVSAIDANGNLTIFMHNYANQFEGIETKIIKYNPNTSEINEVTNASLPDVPLIISCLGIDETNSKALLFSPFGVYSSDFNFVTWSESNNYQNNYRGGMMVNSAIYLNDKIVIGTHGHGLWALDCIFTDITQATNVAIKLYPNPAQDVLFISNAEIGSQYYVYNISGELMKFGNINDAGNVSISIKGLANGTYFIRFSSDSQTFKFIKN